MIAHIATRCPNTPVHCDAYVCCGFSSIGPRWWIKADWFFDGALESTSSGIVFVIIAFVVEQWQILFTMASFSSFPLLCRGNEPNAYVHVHVGGWVRVYGAEAGNGSAQDRMPICQITANAVELQERHKQLNHPGIYPQSCLSGASRVTKSSRGMLPYQGASIAPTEMFSVDESMAHQMYM